MPIALLYAFANLACAATNDLVFKAFTRTGRSHGLFIAVIGIVGCLTVAWGIDPHAAVAWRPTLFWGIAAGVFSVGGNLLLLAAMKRLSGGVCSTIYRLNLVPVALGAWLLLGERLSALKWCGSACAIAAVLCFMPRRDATRADASHRAELAAFAMVVAAAFMRAALGLANRHAQTSAGVDSAWLAFITEACWIVGGLLYAALAERGRLRPDRRLLGFGLLSGLLVAGIISTLALSTRHGEAAVVLPIEQMSFLLTFTAGILFFHEKATPRSYAALACGCAAILLLCLG